MTTIAQEYVIGGEQLTGERFSALLEDALRLKQNQLEADQFNAYERRAIAYMIRREIMPASEGGDPLCFQCRACGWNPYDAKVRAWFWRLSVDRRRELVRLSRKIRVVFWRGGAA